MSDHKYVNKEWKNGRWVYQYKEKPKEEKKYKYIKREWKKDHWEYTYPEDVKEEKLSIFDKIKAKFGIGDDEEETKTTKDEKTKGKSSNPLSKLIDSGKKFIESKKNITNKPVSKLSEAKDVISKGADKVKEFFTKPIEDWERDRTREREVKNQKKREEAQRKHEKEYYTKLKDQEKKREEENKRKREEIDKKTKDLARKEREQQRERRDAVRNAAQTMRERRVRQKELDEQLENLNKKNPLPDLPLKTTAKTLDEDEKAVNPNYNPENDGTSKNCALCTVAYDLRRKGYDVKAQEKVSDLNPLTIGDLYDNTSVYDVQVAGLMYKDKTGKEYDKNDVSTNEMVSMLNEALLNEGEGARGNLGLYWIGGGGHSVVWEVENNKVIIRDTQTNEKFDFKDYDYWPYTAIRATSYIRLDDKIPNENILNYVEPVKR